MTNVIILMIKRSIKMHNKERQDFIYKEIEAIYEEIDNSVS